MDRSPELIEVQVANEILVMSEGMRERLPWIRHVRAALDASPELVALVEYAKDVHGASPAVLLELLGNSLLSARAAISLMGVSRVCPTAKLAIARRARYDEARPEEGLFFCQLGIRANAERVCLGALGQHIDRAHQAASLLDLVKCMLSGALDRHPSEDEFVDAKRSVLLHIFRFHGRMVGKLACLHARVRVEGPKRARRE